MAFYHRGVPNEVGVAIAEDPGHRFDPHQATEHRQPSMENLLQSAGHPKTYAEDEGSDFEPHVPTSSIVEAEGDTRYTTDGPEVDPDISVDAGTREATDAFTRYLSRSSHPPDFGAMATPVDGPLQTGEVPGLRYTASQRERRTPVPEGQRWPSLSPAMGELPGTDHRLESKEMAIRDELGSFPSLPPFEAPTFELDASDEEPNYLRPTGPPRSLASAVAEEERRLAHHLAGSVQSEATPNLPALGDANPDPIGAVASASATSGPASSFSRHLHEPEDEPRPSESFDGEPGSSPVARIAIARHAGPSTVEPTELHPVDIIVSLSQALAQTTREAFLTLTLSDGQVLFEGNLENDGRLALQLWVPRGTQELRAAVDLGSKYRNARLRLADGTHAEHVFR